MVADGVEVRGEDRDAEGRPVLSEERWAALTEAEAELSAQFEVVTDAGVAGGA